MNLSAGAVWAGAFLSVSIVSTAVADPLPTRPVRPPIISDRPSAESTALPAKPPVAGQQQGLPPGTIGVPDPIGSALVIPPPAVVGVHAGGSPYRFAFVTVRLSGIASLASVRTPHIHFTDSTRCRLLKASVNISDTRSTTGTFSISATGILYHPNLASTEISCPFSVNFDRQESDGAWKNYSLDAPEPAVFTPDHLVTISDTQRLHDWLKPEIDYTRSLGNIGCRADIRNGKLAFRIVAHTVADKCTAVLMHLSGSDNREQDRLPEGVIIKTITWRVEQVNGDACGFCPGHNACDLPDLRSTSGFVLDDMETPIREGVTQGSDYVELTGPPNVDPAAGVVGRAGVTFASSDAAHWHEYVYPMGGTLVCRGWEPPSVHDAATAAGNALNGLAHGQTPPPPPPSPEAWLILDEVVFYEPPGISFP